MNNGTRDHRVDPTEPPAENPASVGPVVPLAAWLAVQLAAICLSALQFPWTSRFPQPIEHWALHVLLVGQIVGAALLFPVLLSDARRLVIAIVVIWPPLLLASILAEASTEAVLRSGAYVAGWLVTLWLWRTALCAPRQQLLGVAILSTIVVADPVLEYLGAEFGTHGLRVKGPIQSGLAMLTHPTLPALLVPGAILLIGLVAAAVKWSLHKT